MKSLYNSEGKDVIKHIEENIAGAYERITDNKYDTSFIRGEIFALRTFLKEFGLGYDIIIKTREDKNE